MATVHIVIEQAVWERTAFDVEIPDDILEGDDEEALTDALEAAAEAGLRAGEYTTTSLDTVTSIDGNRWAEVPGNPDNIEF